MSGKERRVSDRSLENLKKGAIARYQGKERHNFTVLPETLQWLKCSGNASGMIDDLVAIARNGGLKSDNTHDESDETRPYSNNVYKQIESPGAELEQLRLERDQLDREVNELHAKIGDLDLELSKIKEQPQQKPDLEAIRDRALTKLKLGKQAPEYKRAKKYMDLLLAELPSRNLHDFLE